MPALVYGVGAAGFFAVPYTVIVFPIVFVFAPRLWSVSRVHNYVTPADFVRGRYGSRGLALAVAATGILATMPYIALQLVGIQAVLTVLGVGASASNSFVKDLPLLIAFLLLAAFTYLSGLRAPALIAFVKDLLVYVMIIVAVLLHPDQAGRLGAHLLAPRARTWPRPTRRPASRSGRSPSRPPGEWAYATLALGSALALFMYPHAVTGVLAAKRRNVIRRNMAILPAYSLVLGLVALLGLHGARRARRARRGQGARRATPSSRCRSCSRRCSRPGSPGSATRPSRSARWCPRRSCRSRRRTCSPATSTGSSSRRDATPAQETRVAQFVSLLVKVGALVFVLALSKTFSINLQLLGGIWILQTFPAIVIGLYTRWFHRWALLLGWAAAMVYGTIVAYNTPAPGVAGSHFGASTASVPGLNHTVYIAVTALVLNLVVAVAADRGVPADAAARRSRRDPARPLPGR